MNPENSYEFDTSAKDNDFNGIVTFYYRAKLDGPRTREEGRPVHVDKPYIKLLIAGGKDQVDRPVTDKDIERFPQQWAAFKNRDETVVEGTPIEEWPVLGRARVADLKYINIRTVEQLAGLDDVGLQKLGPGAQELRKKAQLFIEASKSDAPMYALQKENDTLKGEVDALKEQMAELQADSQKKRGPGRPRKDEAA